MSVLILSQPRTVLSFVTCLLLQAGSLASQNAEVVQRLEEELNGALVRCDAEALGRLWDEQLAFIFPNGNIATKTERIAGLKRCTPGSPNSAIESVDARVYGDVAVAIVLSKWTGATEGKAFEARFRATHVWANRAGSWVLVSAHVSQIKE